MDWRDQYHSQAVQEFERIYVAREPLLTSNYVISETATRLRYDSGVNTALIFRDRLETLEALGRVNIVWVDRQVQASAWVVMEQHGNLVLSLTDATSAVLARQHRADAVFTFDSDFRVLGFQIAPNP